ncbi:4-hydroxy-4-methyl-2-oxoglutarate aldolase (plasmid) [Cupriavidus necator N-1]|uniref:4-hydroxy-4-methyl-2-oxoglutarate aldolase n=1 Tax=Cupriavidus necator (strain ATCC 43291 / DSM 13513 / CCUG 52238 / LMG 8453 / N-1) TaxID=1042878 RepID=F8GUC5_CUPNN|nr:4-carboxy-4-hydroxy-2-oxoadipate aldolase/oxaloacetate decarboxylase [Cupriavidus necator]AEI82329.1 4-hydroxy-4-methyl-2-oxoglutarate aldolase [Cupriavidus necator N-1]MDX6007345.1 4-carboxy-4-hydroxy-2-oxoadipate aldolase/oxaloacetate decarboxylase [Cupriavidus necator]
MTQTVTQQQFEHLKAFGTATIHEAQGQKGALDGALKPLDPTVRMAGPALTVDLRPGDNLMVHYALTKARPGDVLVLDAKAFTEAGPWGDVLTLAAQQVGLAGLVINGAVRDGSAIVEMGFPVFCRGLSIKGTNKNQPGKVNVPVCIGGVSISPGDIVVGDRDGLVVVAAEEIETVIAKSVEREEKEVWMREQLLQGKTMVDLLGLAETLERFGLN